MAINCPVCGAENPDSAEFCNLCLSSAGFSSAEIAVPAPKGEGYLTHYPSSFDENESEQEKVAAWEDPAPEAPPVDIGEYGVRSGHEAEDEDKNRPLPDQH